jgi:hypothetical protein
LPLDPTAAGIHPHVFSAEKIHSDDTPVPVLTPTFEDDSKPHPGTPLNN